MKRSFALITALLFAWLFVVVIPFHHHQTDFSSNDSFQSPPCSGSLTQGGQCQICIISANKLIKTDQVINSYTPLILNTIIVDVDQPGLSFYHNAHSDRAPPELI